jgi:hypothetical protein
VTYPTPDYRLNPPDHDMVAEESILFQAADRMADDAQRGRDALQALAHLQYTTKAPRDVRALAIEFVLEGATAAERAVWTRILSDPFVMSAEDAAHVIDECASQLAYDVREAA